MMVNETHPELTALAAQMKSAGYLLACSYQRQGRAWSVEYCTVLSVWTEVCFAVYEPDWIIA